MFLTIHFKQGYFKSHDPLEFFTDQIPPDQWELDEHVSECDRQDSNTQNDVVRAEVHNRKVRGKSELKSKTTTR